MRTGFSLLKITVAVAVLISVSTAMAQGGKGGKGGGGMRGGGISPIAIVKIEAVQKDLELSSDQKASVDKLEVAAPDFQASQEERQKARDEAKKSVDDILNPPQRGRLAEIMLQLDGVRALRTPEVATKLKLTDEQKTKIDEVFASAGGGGGKGGGKGGKGGGGFGRLSPEQETQVMDVLTADQKTQFTSMQGKKIEIDRTALFGGRGGKGGKNGKGGKAPAPDA